MQRRRGIRGAREARRQHAGAVPGRNCGCRRTYVAGEGKRCNFLYSRGPKLVARRRPRPSCARPHASRRPGQVGPRRARPDEACASSAKTLALDYSSVPQIIDPPKNVYAFSVAARSRARAPLPPSCPSGAAGTEPFVRLTSGQPCVKYAGSSGMHMRYAKTQRYPGSSRGSQTACRSGSGP